MEPMKQSFLAQPWSNGACKGYVILSCRALGYSREEIARLLGQMDRCFDKMGVEDAKAWFEQN